MKKILTLIAILVLSANLFAADMTADDVIGKYLKAIGGEKKLHDLKSLFMQGSMFMQGMPLVIKIHTVLPDKGYQEVLMNNVVMQSGGSDGENVWSTQQGQTFILSGNMAKQVKEQADIFPLLDYKKRGRSAKYISEDMVKGKKAHKIEFITEAGDTSFYYFDDLTSYIVKQKSGDMNMNLTKYKDIGGILFPHKMTMSSPNGQVLMTFDSIAVNIDIPDSLFVMPKGAQPMPDMTRPQKAVKDTN